MFLFILMCICSAALSAPLTPDNSRTASCGELGDCYNAAECTEICGCDGLYYYNATINECLLDFNYIRLGLTEKHNTQEKLRVDAEKVFNGIIVSIIIFITCSSLCAVSACIYCCHINYSDRKLRKDVKALAQKLKRDGKLNKSLKTATTEPVAQSCNIMVEEAGVFVV